MENINKSKLISLDRNEAENINKNKYDIVDEVVRIMCSSTRRDKKCMCKLCKYHYSNNHGDVCNDECVGGSKKVKQEMTDFIIKKYNL